MNIDEKLALLNAVAESVFKISDALERLDIPRSTYYRWRAKYRKMGPRGLLMPIFKILKHSTE